MGMSGHEWCIYGLEHHKTRYHRGLYLDEKQGTKVNYKLTQLGLPLHPFENRLPRDSNSVATNSSVHSRARLFECFDKISKSEPAKMYKDELSIHFLLTQ